METESIRYTRHDAHEEEDAAVIKAGLDRANLEAAPIDQNRLLSCYARSDDGAVLGGELWDQACELQQLWVEPNHRGQGLGKRLVCEFEELSREHGAQRVVLETFSFQAPGFYRSLGYVVRHTIDVYPQGVVKHVMVKQIT